MGEVFDAIIGRVFGFMAARDLRVIWADGTLYVCKSPTDIAVFQCDKPTKRGGTWNVTIGVERLQMQTPGCGSCRRRVQSSPIGQMTVQQIIDAAAMVASE